MRNMLNNQKYCIVLLLLLYNLINYQPCIGANQRYPLLSTNPYSSESLNPDQGQDSQGDEELEYGSQNYFDSSVYHDVRVVDNKGKYILEWIVDFESKTILFNITVETKGWVGLGLSKDGSMKNADIMMGWVGDNGKGYVMDLHTDHNRKLSTDNKQHWKLAAASENNYVTNLLVNRSLDSCDPFDYPITIDLAWVLWAYGEGDVMEYHFDKRGSFRAYLMDPVLQSHKPDLENFRIANNFTLEEGITTTYLCSIHKGPRLHQKHHMVEFHPFFLDTVSASHTHRMSVYLCVVPPGKGAKAIFEPLLDFPGEECIFNTDHEIPIQFCRVLVYGYGRGSNPYILPESTGIPMGESVEEYYMLEVHYDNPEALALQVTSGVDIYYTNELRENEGGHIIINYDMLGLFMIPPISTLFEVNGFCSENCTQSIIPSDGVEILAALLHTRSTGKRMKLQHFRGDKEMEWIIKDDNYDSSFQQPRVLYEPILVLPGDLLVIKCEYDNTQAAGSTLSGFSALDEMCAASILTSKRLPYRTCNSQVPPEQLLSLIGVDDLEWDMDTRERIITAPPDLAGYPLMFAVNNMTDWTKALRSSNQGLQLTTPSVGSCPQILLPTPPIITNKKRLNPQQKRREKQREANLIKQEQRKLLGTIIGSSERFANILKLAKGFGAETLMGASTHLPTRTPGPNSTAQYPIGAERYNAARNCSKIIPVRYSLHYSSQSGAPTARY